jgi:hypothetical protein
MILTLLGSKYLGNNVVNNAAVCVETSDGFKITQLPAAIAPTAGASNKLIGKFQAPMIKTVPRGDFRIWGLFILFKRVVLTY